MHIFDQCWPPNPSARISCQILSKNCTCSMVAVGMSDVDVVGMSTAFADHQVAEGHGREPRHLGAQVCHHQGISGAGLERAAERYRHCRRSGKCGPAYKVGPTSARFEMWRVESYVGMRVMCGSALLYAMALGLIK